jgi:hypothetical protein
MKILILIILSTMFISCKPIDYKLQKELSIQKYIEQNFEKYKLEYEILNKIVIEGVNNKLKTHRSQIGKESYIIDKLMIFNNERTKLYTTLNSINKPTNSGSSSDLVQSLYGVKIKGKWHVYLGENLIAMRGGYKTYKYEPFTWEELSYVAHEQMFPKFITFSATCELELNQDYLNKYINPENVGGTSVSDEGTDEERFIRLWDFKQSKIIDSLEYQDLLNEINNPVPKEREPIKKISWWDKLWGAEEPIFESKEWKEYIMSKQ